ncbi:LysR family transcriptional regulator [Ferrovibrio sp.]|uniref:LysR family transcriptional regulator n=1 Tax=Ferrovibrio sp. TaxID=1917215 RepID=UPI0025C21FE5|nr:LysR family transcriptional regulator [Ferrovibrio sp.]MBX3455973.1 LysR family transcriptional regulator [Ferrovibrio sp.]
MDAEYQLYARVIETGSLAAAGRSLNLSPAMVSKRIARLEERLGAKLLHRTTRKLSTTEAGQRFYERVAQILAASREAENLVSGIAGDPNGLLRISAPTSFGRLHVAPHLKPFLDRWPRLQVELELSDAYSDLVAERIDVAIRVAANIEGGLSGHKLAPNRRFLCASPAYLAEHGAPTRLKDLARHRLLAADGQLPWRLQGRPGSKDSGPVSIAGTSILRTNSSEVVRELALAGMGIALRSTWDIGPDLRAGRLRVVLPEHPGAADVNIFAVHPASNYVPAGVVRFIEHLRRLYAPAPYWDADLEQALNTHA